MSFFTLEDVNTIILKYSGIDAPQYSMPHINIESNLYRGNANNVSDVINLPEGVEYTVYFENRPVEVINLPRDYKDTCTLRVVTMSSYPYVNSDVEITIPVVTKHLTSLNDLNNYDYGYIDILSNVTGTITNDVYILLEDNASFTGCNLTINADVTLNGDLSVSDTFIINNSSLSFEEVSFTSEETGNDYLIVNNKNMEIRNSTISSTLPFILNKGSMVLSENTFECLSVAVPFIYTNGEYIISGNTVNYSSTVEYEEFGACFIRGEIDTTTMIRDNTFNYSNVKVTIDEADYYLTGNGLCYALIDDDTVYVKDLEVV